MWSIIKTILAKWAQLMVLIKLLKKLRWLVLLIPIALVLVFFFGWPALLVVGVLAIPVILVLVLVGLPRVLVGALGALILGALFALLKFGLLLLKVALPILLVVWLLRKLGGCNGRRDRPGAAPPPPPPPPPPGPVPEPPPESGEHAA